jgi:uncharacterized protein YjiS (DUF1127 family)
MNPRLSSVETAMPGPSPAVDARGTHPRGLAQGIAAAVHGLRAVLTALRQRRETIAQLRALSDRELADIGLDRGAIPAAAARPLAANDASETRHAA